MIDCPFCESKCKANALLCPQCKAELPSAEMLGSFRIALESDRSLADPAKRKKLDALAKKTYKARMEAIQKAQADYIAEQKRLEAEREKADAEKAEAARIRAEESNIRFNRNLKKYGPVAGILVLSVFIFNFYIWPPIQENRLKAEFRDSTISACDYARDIESSIQGHYKKLSAVLSRGDRFSEYWKKENTRVTSLHIDKIRSTYVNSSSSQQIVLPEVSSFENDIAYDLNRLRTVFSTYWDLKDLEYYGEKTILRNNKKFIAWCAENQA